MNESEARKKSSRRWTLKGSESHSRESLPHAITSPSTEGRSPSASHGTHIGWLESSPSSKSEGRHDDVGEHPLGDTDVVASAMAENMLGAVSREDIVKLTQLTRQLPDSTRKHTKHNRHVSEDRSRAKTAKTHSRTVSQQTHPIDQSWYDSDVKTASSNDLSDREANGLHVITQSAPQASQSTPPSGSLSGLTDTGHQRSWYKFILRDKKSKKKATGNEDRDSPSSTRTSAEQSEESLKSQAVAMKRESSQGSVKSHGSGSGGRWRWSPIDASSSSSSSPADNLIRRMTSLHSSSNLKNKLWPTRRRRVPSTAASFDSDESSDNKPPSLPTARRHSFDSMRLTRDSPVQHSPLRLSLDDASAGQKGAVRKLNSEDKAEMSQHDILTEEADYHSSGFDNTTERSFSLDNGSAAKSSRPTSLGSRHVDDDSTGIPPQSTVLLFDYDTLPNEIKYLISQYEAKGRVKMRSCLVSYRKEQRRVHESSDDDEDENEDENMIEALGGKDRVEDEQQEQHMNIDNAMAKTSNEDTVEAVDMISSEPLLRTGIHDSLTKRTIAEVHVQPEDAIHFKKLCKLPANGTLVNLCISLWPNDRQADAVYDYQRVESSVDDQLQNYETVLENVKAFLREHRGIIEQLSSEGLQTLFDETLKGTPFDLDAEKKDPMQPPEETMIPRPDSVRNASSEMITMLPGWFSFKFDERLEELNKTVSRAMTELDAIDLSLNDTETMIHNVTCATEKEKRLVRPELASFSESDIIAASPQQQLEINEARLKKMENDIEAMFSSRTDNVLIEAGYTLLSYVIILIAVMAWIIVRIPKVAKAIVVVPLRIHRRLRSSSSSFPSHMNPKNKAL